MKAYMFTDQGPAIRETPKMPPKANQVSVRVYASALNRVDLVMAQGAPQKVLDEKRAEVADMRKVVDGGATGVHLHRVIGERLEGFNLLSQGIVQL